MKRRHCVLAALAVALIAGAAPPQSMGSDERAMSVAAPRVAVGDRDAAAQHDSFEACTAALSQPAEDAVQPAPARLRVMSWNTMKYSRDGSRGLLDRISDHVDFVLLQEATRRDRPARSNAWYRYFADGYLTWGERQTGVELRSRYRADTVCTLSFTEPWLRSPKAVLAARLPFTDYALLLVNLHAINFTVGTGAYRAQLDAIGALLASHAGPAIVAGDFNNWNGGRQRVLEHFARRQNLSLARFEPDWRSRHLGTPVDGLLQRGLKVLDATALPTSRSDHHPLIVLLQRAPAPSRRAAPAADDGQGARP